MVLSHPEMLGEGVFVVTSEFDRWYDRAGQVNPDRLDVLGLGHDGRLIVAELKREDAPMSTTMQAINYAARASRFTVDGLAECHAAFAKGRGENLSPAAAEERLRAHADALDDDTLLRPRIVLLAGQFPAALTASAVWLSESGIDITLRQLRAYRVADGTTIATVSQLFPVPDVEEFTLAPARQQARAAEMPVMPWTADDLERLVEVANLATVTALRLCAEAAGEWVSYEDVITSAALTTEQARGQFAGLTMTVKSKFHRSNRPFETRWGHGGTASYQFTPDVLAAWRARYPAGDSGDAETTSLPPVDHEA